MKRRPLVFIAVLAAVGFALWWGFRQQPAGKARSTAEPDGISQTTRSAPASEGQTGSSSTGSSGDRAVASAAVDKAGIMRIIADALEAMRKGDREEIERSLARLDEALGAGGDRAASIAAIVDFLKTGADARTGNGFVIGEGGLLADATTLRVYLMDKLGRLCREAGTGEALEVARQTLSDFGSADEWAISMRNVAWADPDSRAFLEERVNAMIAHPQWRDHPSTGMLEAFDVIVHTGSMDVVPELGRLISLPESALGRASGVALDRLGASHPLELTSLLNRQPELLSGTPMVRADLFAHAGLGVPEQRRQLEDYLLRPDVDAAEREKFFSSLIQTGQFVSHNLITPLVPPEEPAQAEARLEVLTRTVNEWMRDDRFKAFANELSDLGETVNGIIEEISADEAAGGSK